MQYALIMLQHFLKVNVRYGVSIHKQKRLRELLLVQESKRLSKISLTLRSIHNIDSKALVNPQRTNTDTILINSPRIRNKQLLIKN